MKKFALVFIFLLLGCIGPPSILASVKVQQTINDEWELLVDGKTYFIKGVDYRVTKIGQSPDNGTLEDWAYYDFNVNGRVDGPYEAWVDKNFNNIQDADEPNVGDFELMRQMGVNTIRWYVNDFKGQKADKKLLRDLFSNYGIRVAVGNKFGAYTIDSGASWHDGTDYRDPEQQKHLLESITKMVMEHKDEPYTLLWLIGNENNYRWSNTNAYKYPQAYARLVNEAARLIHKLDGQHPVALVNGDTRFLNIYQKYCPDIDIFAVNAYRGPNGFGSLWEEIKHALDKPVLISEFGGAQASAQGEEKQAVYHKNCWLDIENNRPGVKGEGNAIGGFAFEWLDEWWKAGDPLRHAQQGSVHKQGLDTASWAQAYCGIFSQGDGSKSPFMRQPRKIYDVYKTLWK
jgi:beta-glucuronidase